jgi:hypothetical protein
MGDHDLFSALKQSIGGHKLKSDRDVQRVVTRWLIGEDADRYKLGQKSSSHGMINATVLPKIMWEIAGKRHS